MESELFIEMHAETDEFQSNKSKKVRELVPREGTSSLWLQNAKHLNQNYKLRQKIIAEGESTKTVYILIEGECMMMIGDSPLKRYVMTLNKKY